MCRKERYPRLYRPSVMSDSIFALSMICPVVVGDRDLDASRRMQGSFDVMVLMIHEGLSSTTEENPLSPIASPQRTGYPGFSSCDKANISALPGRMGCRDNAGRTAADNRNVVIAEGAHDTAPFDDGASVRAPNGQISTQVSAPGALACVDGNRLFKNKGIRRADPRRMSRTRRMQSYQLESWHFFLSTVISLFSSAVFPHL